MEKKQQSKGLKKQDTEKYQVSPQSRLEMVYNNVVMLKAYTDTLISVSEEETNYKSLVEAYLSVCSNVLENIMNASDTMLD